MKTLVAIAAISMGLASPAFAQSYNAAYVPQSQWHHGMRALQRPGQHAYAMVPASRINPNSPALTGGGSVGYNEAPLNS